MVTGSTAEQKHVCVLISALHLWSHSSSWSCHPCRVHVRSSPSSCTGPHLSLSAGVCARPYWLPTLYCGIQCWIWVFCWVEDSKLQWHMHTHPSLSAGACMRPTHTCTHTYTHTHTHTHAHTHTPQTHTPHTHKHTHTYTHTTHTHRHTHTYTTYTHTHTRTHTQSMQEHYTQCPLIL